MTYINSDVAYSHLGYCIGVENATVEEIQVRKWGDKEWNEATLEYLGLEDK